MTTLYVSPQIVKKVFQEYVVPSHFANIFCESRMKEYLNTGRDELGGRLAYGHHAQLHLLILVCIGIS